MKRDMALRRRQLREWYGLEYPESFFGVWELARELKPREPCGAFEDALSLSLDGAFDVLAGKFDRKPPEGRLWTYDMSYNDPPEFQLVFWGGGDGHHFGLWFDDPAQPPTCVVAYYNNDAYDLSHYPANLFLMLRRELEEQWVSVEENDEDDEEEGREYELLRESIRPHMPGASKRRKHVGEAYVDRYMEDDVDDSELVAVTWGQECIRAPHDTYRAPSKDDETIWREVRARKGAAKWLKEADEALRAGYPATALKLGKDVRHLCKKEDEPAACAVMAAAYVALRRGLLAEILKARTAQREAWDAGRAR
jgi:hypothetical protein